MVQGIVYNIQRFSLQDGPGIRTTVFLKGCPLRCLWCSNPESQDSKPQLMFFKDQCLHCGKCAGICPSKAISMASCFPETDYTKCTACGKCAELCPGNARSISGKIMDVSHVMEEIRKDYIHYMTSGGGVTISGGEPSMQPDFVIALAKEVFNEGYSLCIDTCLCGKWEVFEQLIPYTDLFLVDCKHIDSVMHKKLTGFDNALILDNMQRLARIGVPIRVRIPFIPGYNGTKDNIGHTGEFLSSIGIKDVDIIAYHKLGLSKYAALGREYAIQGELDPNILSECVGILKGYKLNVQLI